MIDVEEATLVTPSANHLNMGVMEHIRVCDRQVPHFSKTWPNVKYARAGGTIAKHQWVML